MTTTTTNELIDEETFDRIADILNAHRKRTCDTAS